VPDQVPMPGFASLRCAGILERLVLESVVGKSHGSTVRKQALSVGRYKVRHRASLPHVPMEPEPTVHRVDHSLATSLELDVDEILVPELHEAQG